MFLFYLYHNFYCVDFSSIEPFGSTLWQLAFAAVQELQLRLVRPHGLRQVPAFVRRVPLESAGTSKQISRTSVVCAPLAKNR